MTFAMILKEQIHIKQNDSHHDEKLYSKIIKEIQNKQWENLLEEV